MASYLLEPLAGIVLGALWVIALNLVGDHLAGIPTMLVFGHDPETEARKQRILTKRLLRRRIAIVPLTIVMPTALLTGAVVLLGHGKGDQGLLWYVWAFAVAVSGLLIYDSVSRLREAR